MKLSHHGPASPRSCWFPLLAIAMRAPGTAFGTEEEGVAVAPMTCRFATFFHPMKFSFI